MDLYEIKGSFGIFLFCFGSLNVGRFFLVETVGGSARDVCGRGARFAFFGGKGAVEFC